MLTNWPRACHDSDPSVAGCRFDRPALGVCFDISRIDSGKFGQTCWEILWRAVPPRYIAGSQLFEGYILKRENVYCLAFLNADARLIERMVSVLERNAGFLKVCATPRFCEGEVVLREPLIAAGHINEEGNPIGIGINARLALNQIRREKFSTASPVMVSSPATQENGNAPGAPVKAPAEATASAQADKWWHVWKQ